MKRARRREYDTVTDAERDWATGEHPDPEVRYFTPPERLRAVYEAVHGETVEALIGRSPERWRAGPVHVNGAQVGRLDAGDVGALKAGRGVAL